MDQKYRGRSVPAATILGGPGFTLAVIGTGFVQGSVVEWNGSPRATTYINSSRLTSQVFASDVAVSGTVSVTVLNPGLGRQSNVQFFDVTTPDSSFTFSETDYVAGNSPQDIIAGDFNGDGRLDLATANLSDNTVSLLEGNGDGTFQPAVSHSVGNRPVGIASADFDGDGTLDLVVVNLMDSTVSILLGNGDGTFRSPANYPTGGRADYVSVGDFNGDGKLDLAVTRSEAGDSKVAILLGNGDGTFRPYVDYPGGPSPIGITVGDFNQDGKLDLAVTNSGLVASDEGVSVLLGNGDGTFQPPVLYATGVGPLTSVATADLNGDGKLDLVATGIGSGAASGGISILLGNGDGTFKTHTDYLLNYPVDSIAIEDFDGDGQLDLAVPIATTSSMFAILPGNGDGTFGAATTFSTGYIPAGIVAGDFNGDGRFDVVTGNRDTSISVDLQVPVVSLSPPNLSFGNQIVGTMSSVQNVLLTNSGSGILMPRITIMGTNSADFSQTNNCGASLSVGTGCTIGVAFTPTGAGVRTATLTFTDNAADSPQTVNLSGTGVVVPTVSVSPTELRFKNRLIGTTSLPEVVTVSNTSTTGAVLTVQRILISGANSTDFTVSNACANPVVQGSTCTLSVTLTPTHTGKRYATLNILDNGLGSPQAVFLSGKGHPGHAGLGSHVALTRVQ